VPCCRATDRPERDGTGPCSAGATRTARRDGGCCRKNALASGTASTFVAGKSVRRRGLALLFGDRRRAPRTSGARPRAECLVCEKCAACGRECGLACERGRCRSAPRCSHASVTGRSDAARPAAGQKRTPRAAIQCSGPTARCLGFNGSGCRVPAETRCSTHSPGWLLRQASPPSPQLSVKRLVIAAVFAPLRQVPLRLDHSRGQTRAQAVDLTCQQTR
jgi:hypothetical protein